LGMPDGIAPPKSCVNPVNPVDPVKDSI
jgi:hypothetical protein